MAQMGFFDVEERYAGLDAKKDPLLAINAAVPWEQFRELLQSIWRMPAQERKSIGRPQALGCGYDVQG